MTEDEIRGIGGENIEGAYACMKYFQSLENENNEAFVKAFKEMWGDDIVIGDVTQAAYLGPWLWKAAVEKLPAQLRCRQGPRRQPGHRADLRARRLRQSAREPPPVVQDPRRSRPKQDGQYEVVFETADLVEPDPFPEGYQ